jgi:D-alanyl-D-alanine endopeptidase (penicillin-binding protein 7)
MRRLFLLVLFFTQFAFAENTTYVYNITKEQAVIEINPSKIRSIASITKLMTATVVLSREDMPLNEKVKYRGSKNVPPGMLTRDQLLSLMLVKSDNSAANALAESFPYGGRDEFIHQMNLKAKELGMHDTRYEDPSGLGRWNLSTAKDLVTLLVKAHEYPKIKQIASSPDYRINVYVKKKKKKTSNNRTVTVNNTSKKLLDDFTEIEISKTGFTNPAGRCLVLFVHKGDENYGIVILGLNSKEQVQKTARKILKEAI